MHPKNKHNSPYNFNSLCEAHPLLSNFVKDNGYGKESIDFSKADAVYHLNKALLKLHYGIKDWNLPDGYLCPPVPSRADYLLYVNDLLSQVNLTPPLKVLDVGVGANAIYCLLGASIFGWNMVGCDIDPKAIAFAKQNIEGTERLQDKIEIRHQTDNAYLFKNIIQSDEFFHATVCNPPFYASEEQANAATMRKLKKLNPEKSILELERNFKGQPNELWCNGGEALFIKRMIKQSVEFKNQVGWFSTLVSRNETLEKTYKLLNKAGAIYKTLQLEQGNKISRVVAWRFS